MAGTLKFSREFAEFGPHIRDFEKANDVGIIVTEFLWFWGAPFYPIGDLMEARISAVPLGDGDPSSEELIDLVFQMPSGNPDEFFYEIVLRVEGNAVYGGFAYGASLSVRDEIVNGHRVLEAKVGGDIVRYIYQLDIGQYGVDEATVSVTTALARRIAKRRR